MNIDFLRMKLHFRRVLDGMDDYLHMAHPAYSNAGSQFEEDEIIRELLPHSDGVYIDVGASHPMECSNTWALYQRGWRGLLIEPLHSVWPAILRHRPGDHLFPVAAMDKKGFVNLRVCGSVSSVREDWKIEADSELLVECDTLADILLQYPVIREKCELLSIDVEGAEWNVIRGIDWSNFRPRVLVIEKLRYDPEKLGEDMSAEWERLVLQEGYVLKHETPINKIYVAEA